MGCSSILFGTEQYFIVPETERMQAQYYNAPQTTDLSELKNTKLPNESLTATASLEDQQTLITRKQFVDVWIEKATPQLESLLSQIQVIFKTQIQRTQIHNQFLKVKSEIVLLENSKLYLKAQIQLLNQKMEESKKESNLLALTEIEQQKNEMNQKIESIEMQIKNLNVQSDQYLQSLKNIEAPRLDVLQQLQIEYQKGFLNLQQYKNESQALTEKIGKSVPIQKQEHRGNTNFEIKPIQDPKQKDLSQTNTELNKKAIVEAADQFKSFPEIQSVDKNKDVINTKLQQKKIETLLLATATKSNETVIQKIMPPRIIPIHENKKLQEIQPRSALTLPITGILSGSFSRLKKVTPKFFQEEIKKIPARSQNLMPSNVDLNPQKTVINRSDPLKKASKPKKIENKTDQSNIPKLIVDSSSVTVSNVPHLVEDKGANKKETEVYKKNVIPNTPSVVIENDMFRTETKEPTPVALSTDPLNEEKKEKEWFDLKPEFFLTYHEGSPKKENDSSDLQQSFNPQITMNMTEQGPNVVENKLQKKEAYLSVVPQFVMNEQ